MKKLRASFESKPHYSIRKLSVGVASVIVGLSFFGFTSNVVKADDQAASTVEKSEQHPEKSTVTSDTEKLEEKQAQNTVDINTASLDTDVKASLNEVNDEKVAKETSKTTVNLNSEKKSQLVQVKEQSTTKADKDKSNSEAKSDDSSTKAKTPESDSNPQNVSANVNDWEYNTNNNQDINLTNYIGKDKLRIVIPNDQDFIQAGKLKEGHAVKITSSVMHDIIVKNQPQSVVISKNDNGKVVAADSNWSNAFGGQLSDTRFGVSGTDPKLKVLDVTNLDTHNITNFSQMFYYGTDLTSVGDLSNWDVSNGTNFVRMFKNASSLTTIGDLSNWNVSNGTDFTGMFNQARHIEKLGDLSHWNVAKSKSFANMFRDAWNLHDIGDVSGWNVANSRDVSWMFGNSALDRINISGWDLRNAKNFSNMFQGEPFKEVKNPDNGLWIPQPVHHDKIIVANDIKLPANAAKIITDHDFAGGSSHQFVITNNDVLLNLETADIKNTITIMENQTTTLFTFVMPTFFKVTNMNNIEAEIRDQIIDQLEMQVDQYDRYDRYKDEEKEKEILGYTTSQLKAIISPISQDFTISDNKQIGTLTIRTQNSDGTIKDVKVPIIWNMSQLKQEEVQEVIAVLPNGDRKVLNRQVVQYYRDIMWDKLLIDEPLQFTDWKVVPGTSDHWKDLAYYTDDSGTLYYFDGSDNKDDKDIFNASIPGYELEIGKSGSREIEKQVLDDENGPYGDGRVPRTFTDEEISLYYKAKKYHANFKYVRDSDKWDYPKFQNNNVEETYDETVSVPDQYKTLPQFFINNHLKLSYIEYEGKHYQPADLTKLKYSFTKDTDFIYHLVPTASVITYKDVTGLDKKDYDSKGVVITDSVMNNLNVDPNPKNENGKWDYDTNGWNYPAVNWKYVNSVSPDKINLTVYLKANDRSINRTIKYVDKNGKELLPDESKSISVTHKVGEFEKDLKPKYEEDLGEDSIFNIPSTKEINGQTYYFDANNSNFKTSAIKDNQPITDNGITVDKFTNTISINVPKSVANGTNYIFVLPYVQSHINVIYKDVTDVDDDQKAKAIEGHEKIVYTEQPGTLFRNKNGWDYEKEGWVVAKTSERPIVFVGQKDGDYSQDYVIYLKHGTEDKEVTKTETRTIHYVDENGNSLQDSTVQKVTLNGKQTWDNVTGKQIGDTIWTVVTPKENDGVTVDESSKASFNKVQQNVITKDGNTWTIKYVTKGSLSGQSISSNYAPAELITNYKGNEDIYLIYTKDQNAQIKYVDDTTGDILIDWINDSDKHGKTGEPINFKTSPVEQIKEFETKGYVLVRNDFKDNPKYKDGDNKFEVHFIHGVVQVIPNTPSTDVPKTPNGKQLVDPNKLTKTINLNVTYVNSDNTLFTGTVPGNAKQTLTFTGKAYIDKITGQFVNVKQEDGQWVVDKDNTAIPKIIWTPEKDSSFAAVSSPVETGYHVTSVSDYADGNNVAVINGITKDSQDINITITYSPNGQEAKNKQNILASQIIHFVDNTGKTIRSDQKQEFEFNYSGDIYDSTTNQKIKDGSWNKNEYKFENITVPVIHGYVANRVTAGGFTATHDKTKFEDTVIYTPIANIIPIDKNRKPISNSSKVSYENDPSDPTKVQSDEKTPKISGWHLQDSTQVVITPQDPTKDTYVVYIKEASGDIVYIDDTVNDPKRNKLGADSFKGDVDSKIDYITADKISNYEKQGYKLISNKFRDGNESFVDGTNHFEVHFIHTLTARSGNVTRHRTIKYFDGETGASLEDKAKTVTQTVNYKNTAVVDQVTGNVIGYNTTGKLDANKQLVVETTDENKSWLPDGTDSYAEVTSPKIYGYKSVPSFKLHEDNQDAATVAGAQANPLKDGGEVDVYYFHDVDSSTETATQKRVIKYFDANTGKPINDPKTGDVMQTVTWKRTKVTDKATGTTGYNLTGKKDQYGNLVIEETDPDKAWVVTSEDKNYVEVTSPDLTDLGYKKVPSLDKNNDQGNASVVTEENANPLKDGGEVDVYYFHNTKQVTDKSIVNMTVHYKYAGNEQEISHKTQTIDFVKSGIEDLVVKKIMWDKVNSQSFKDTQTPEIKGYTPDQKNVVGPTVSFGDKDIDITVTYSANPQHAMVEYIDDTENKVIAQSPILSGVTDGTINYNTDQTIKALEDEGYVLVQNGDETKINQMIFDNDDNSDQLFRVHFVHNLIPVTPKDQHGVDPSLVQKDVKETIKYVGAGDKTPKDVVQTSQWTRQLTYDNVTKRVVPNGKLDTAWAIASGQKINYDEVKSPEVEGYHPDRTIIASTPVTQENITKIVTYSPNGQEVKNQKDIPATQTTKFVDDNGKEIAEAVVQNSNFYYSGDTYDKITGKQTAKGSWDAESHKFNSVNAPVIKGYIADAKTAEGLTATIENPNVENKIFYHKIGKIIPVDPEHNPIPDASTPEYENDPKDPTKVIPNESTPNVSGWHTDTPSVTPQDPTKDTQVVYNQTVEGAVTYIDDTTNQTLGKVDSVKGYVGDNINYSTQDRINNYTSKGYELVSDGFTTSDQVFKKANNNFEVHFIHATKQVTRTDDVEKTIHYVYENGRQAQPDNAQTVHFTESGVEDLVTGKTKWTNATSQSFADVSTPKIEGYTSDQTNVAGQTVNFGDKDIHVTVTYKADPQTAHVIFRDDDSGTDLEKQDMHGVTDGDIDFSKAQNSFNEYLLSRGFEFVNLADETASRNNASDIQDQFVTDDKDKAMSFTSKFGNPKYEQFFVVHLRHTKQSAMVQYVDDTENKVISTSGMLNGKSGEQIDYSTVNTIDQLIGKGYELVSDTTNGQPIILDQDSNSDQVYLVHLKHGIRPTKPGDKNKDGSNVVLTGKATAVIHYVDENGIKVADDKVQTIHFKRTGKTDAVTGEVIELDPWIADKSFISIKSPDVPGYTADKKEVLPATPMEPEEKAQEYIVVYTENEPGSNGSQDGDNGGGNDTDDNGGSSTDNPPSEDEPSTEVPTWVKNNEEKDTYVEKHKDSKPVYEDNKAVAKQIKNVAADAKRSARDGDVIGKTETVNKRIVSADVHTTDKEQAELPQTGEKQNKLGLIGLAFASIAGLFGLAGNRKQRK